ncbi:DUF397 domain-containing protein [Streptomyces sp. WZ.A104]|uniref:DUF397 domain-containing protein n=1 Tax=Streptomyces sp. WZ.A104 TaxID=2023771 RepID=UPI00211BB66F|nr:DUF397 domain-containing protein [Streptomyces sp. WZ.A104]
MENCRNGIPASSFDAVWTKSHKSAANGQCIELAPIEKGVVALRNSRDPHGPALLFTAAEVDAFLDGARKGEFDHLTAN